METNGSDTKQEQQEQTEPPKITSEVKVKNPLRVAQGKRLAAISREAKARKAKEREASIRREEVDRCERSEKENYFPSYALLPVIGILVVGGGYYFFQRKKKPDNNNNDNNEKPSENSNLENF